MTLGDIRTRVRTLFAEPDPNRSFILDAEIDSWANDCQNDLIASLVDDLLWELTDKGLDDTVISQADYDLPSGFVRLRFATIDTVPCLKLDVGYVPALTENSFYVPSITSPVCYIWNDKITFMPTPTANGSNNIEYWYVKQPAALSLVGDIPQFATSLHELIVLYCTYMALLKDRRVAEGRELYGLYLQKIKILNDKYVNVHRPGEHPTEKNIYIRKEIIEEKR